LTRRLAAAFAFLLAAGPASAKDVPLPEIRGIAHWLNTDRPLTPDDLRGKVVLIDFWTYSCINCIRTFPHLNDWHRRYASRGLVIVGVHTPEFAFEKDPANVRAALAEHGIAYPVAMDNDYATWRAFSNRYWPAHYLADRGGVVRYTHFGEGNYAETERAIERLLAEGGEAAPAAVPAERPPAADLSRVKTPEIYLGYERLSRIANREPVLPDRRQTFREPDAPAPGRFHLAGEWRVAKTYAELEGPAGKIVVRYDADKANMVLASADGRELIAEVYVDGRPATAENRGRDVVLEGGRALCRVREPRLYNLAATAAAGRHTLELRFLSPGARAYTFTFG
jgi:thiol-disulfide isomerase/thioredoxin